MKIKLYLKKINQEMIDSGRITKPREKESWVVSWPKSCCILDFGMVRPGSLVETPVTNGLMLREEKEGGMFWDPKTGAVYKVDEEAYHTMLEIDRGYSAREIAKRMKISEKKVSVFIAKLRGIRK